MRKIARILGISLLVVVSLVVLSSFCGQCFAASEEKFLSVDKVKKGMDGCGLTVFEGITPEEFNLRTDGVLEFDPEWKLILARLSGGPVKDLDGNPIPLEKTGVISAMSGSPAYIDGKLVGAVAYSMGRFTYEANAGITPIKLMIEAGKDESLQKRYLPPEQISPIGIPLLVSDGLKVENLENLISLFEKRGFDVEFIPTGKSDSSQEISTKSGFKPGSSISVLFMRGDFIIGSVGTVTYIDGKKVYAFGHSLLGLGNVDFPFYQSQILKVVASSYDSFKISGGVVGESLGAIKRDTFAGIVGILGAKAKMIPVSLHFKNEQKEKTFKVEIVDDRIITETLIMLAFRSAFECFQEDLSFSTVKLELKIKIKDDKVLEINDIFITGRGGFSDFFSQFNRKVIRKVLNPLFESNFKFELESVEFNVEISKRRRVLILDETFLSKKTELVGQESIIEKKEGIELVMVLKDIETGEKYLKRLAVPIIEDVTEGRVKIKIDSGTSVKLLRDIEYPQNLSQHLKQLARYYFSNNEICIQIIYPLEKELKEIEIDPRRATLGGDREAQRWERVAEEEKISSKDKEAEIKLIRVSTPFEGTIRGSEVLMFSIEKQEEEPEEEIDEDLPEEAIRLFRD